MLKKSINILFVVWYLLSANTTLAYTHADTLRGSNGRYRDWWDVQRYELGVNFDLDNQSINGYTIIDFRVTKKPADSMQIDLQEHMEIDSVFQRYGGVKTLQPINFRRDGNVCWVYFERFPFHNWLPTEMRSIKIYYHGTPRKAVNPPWDGGFSWKTDNEGKQWVAVSCQGLGASVWWPCKDAQWDEPEQGMDIYLTVPENYSAISNGRLKDTVKVNSKKVFYWQLKNPINNYDVTFYIGDYVHWQDTLTGEKGKLDLDYWVLRDNEEKARKQFAVVKPMLHCYEYWLGPYPFYEDGYKLVEAPYLGMEHQSAIAYGNKYQMGYLGSDRSNTSVGMHFDYIIVHESGHEWFGNSITAKDIADNWIHEGMTTFSESLFTECLLGKEKGQTFCKGEWGNIRNDKPVTGDYGVNNEGSNDIYDKGAAMMYMIRMLMNDDEKFRQMLRGVSKTFYHQTVTTQQIESYIAKATGLDLTAFFNQYLRTTNIPQLAYYIKDGELNYRFENIVPGFTLPIPVSVKKKTEIISPTADWQHIEWKHGYNLKVSPDYLIKVK